jgi:YHS domain-containing protein
MRVDRYQTPHTTRWREQTVYFCSAGCQQAFEADPERYADGVERRGPWRAARVLSARRS